MNLLIKPWNYDDINGKLNKNRNGNNNMKIIIEA
jgi:hypothetical protein